MISYIYKKKKVNEDIWIKSFKNIGKIIKYIIMFILRLYSIGEIIIHQILIYRSLCGIINILGGYNYEIMDLFLSESDFGKYKLLINFLTLFLIILPIYFLQFHTNDNKSNLSSSEIGVFILTFITVAILIQFPFYLVNFLNEGGHKVNDINFYPNKKKGLLKHFQIFGILFYCFSGHNGLNQIINEVKEEEKRINIYRNSNLFNSIIFLIISIFGYLSIPVEFVNNITERKQFWSKDIIMTFSKIMLIPMSINKIQINSNIIKDTFSSLLDDNPDDKKNNSIKNKTSIGNSSINLKRRIINIFVILTLIITTIISSFYQNIAFYVTFIGGLITFPAFLIPSIIYIQLNDDKKYYIIFGIILFLLGSYLLYWNCWNFAELKMII
jgi:hypothetical protein